MSLIPSESANFPDLIGQHHGYRHPNAQRRSPRRAQRQAAAPPELLKTREATVETPKPETAVRTPSVPSKAPEPTAIEPRNDPVESSRLLRMALRVPPQRSVAQMRAKIETQEETPTGPQAAMRPRTPTRGLVVAHATSALIVGEDQAKSAPPPRLPRFHWN